jgi:hypothetical protein
MPDLHGHYCAAATLFLCKTSGKMAMITYCEKTEKDVASNYRAELIGGVIVTLVFRILSKLVPHQEKHTNKIHRDNMSVVAHGNGLFWSLPERQVQADLIILLRHNIIQSHLQITYCHVYGHLDNHKTFSDLTLPQKLNVMADKLAKECLLNQIRRRSGWSSTYPLEHVRIWKGWQKGHILDKVSPIHGLGAPSQTSHFSNGEILLTNIGFIK